MSTEWRQGKSVLPTVDPRQFLDRPFERLEVGRLASAPDIALLRWLPTLTDETGVVLQRPTWHFIKASEIGIPAWLMPPNSDILLHSHPIDEDERENDGSVPSIRDFLNCSPIARNFIASFRGITQYWQIENEEARRALQTELYSDRYGKGSKERYLQFLRDVGVRYDLYLWDEIDERKLGELLNTQDL